MKKAEKGRLHDLLFKKRPSWMNVCELLALIRGVKPLHLKVLEDDICKLVSNIFG